MPSQAAGATPEIVVAGCPREPGTATPFPPAAIPATCVPWKDSRRSNGSRAAPSGWKADGNERATITRPVV
ncbi:MAG: hypothetical protein R3C15_19260 [Thermoleophilia bacterium]